MGNIELSVLIPVRGRVGHVRSLLPRLAASALVRSGRCEVILVESGREFLHADACEAAGVRHLPVTCDGVFHKTRLLNIAMRNATGEKVAPYDVDLIPIGRSLDTHLRLALACDQMLVTGFRLMSRSRELLPDAELPLDGVVTAPENTPSALRKWLLDGERFGAVPMFCRRRLEAVGGWDETFVGWGAEDQEVIERYLGGERHLVLSPDIVYLHLGHPGDEAWSEDEWAGKNRGHYYRTRSGRSPPRREHR